MRETGRFEYARLPDINVLLTKVYPLIEFINDPGNYP